MSNLFSQLPEKVQNNLATSAGIMLSTFDPNGELVQETIRQSILFATSGGVQTVCTPEFEDFGEDIDNCAKNTKELLRITGYECKMSGTALTVTKEVAKSLIGAADETSSPSGTVKIKPRMDIKLVDFKEMWYVCPYGIEGGFVAVKLSNALSTGGFSSQSEDKQKSKFEFEFTGYSSIDTPEDVPFEFYLKEKASMPAQALEMDTKKK